MGQDNTTTTPDETKTKTKTYNEAAEQEIINGKQKWYCSSEEEMIAIQKAVRVRARKENLDLVQMHGKTRYNKTTKRTVYTVYAYYGTEDGKRYAIAFGHRR